MVFSGQQDYFSKFYIYLIYELINVFIVGKYFAGFSVVQLVAHDYTEYTSRVSLISPQYFTDRGPHLITQPYYPHKGAQNSAHNKSDCAVVCMELSGHRLSAI